MRGMDPYEQTQALRKLAESIFRASESNRLVGAAVGEQQLISTYQDESIIPHPKHIGAVSDLEKQADATVDDRLKRSNQRRIKEQRRKLVTMHKGAKPLIDPLFTTPDEPTREVVTFQPKED